MDRKDKLVEGLKLKCTICGLVRNQEVAARPDKKAAFKTKDRKKVLCERCGKESDMEVICAEVYIPNEP